MRYATPLLFLSLLPACANRGEPQLEASHAPVEVIEEPEPVERPRNILFVGNSFTHYNEGLETHYAALVKSADPTFEGRIQGQTISGGRMPQHKIGLFHKLDTDPWDIIVLQGHSMGPISEVTSGQFRDAARMYAPKIRESGAEPVFFMTWAYTDRPAMTAQLEEAYTSIGTELDAQVVPVGLAFARAHEENPGVALRTEDRKHPTLAGTYLAACTFYAALCGESPEGLSYTAGLEPETATWLQRIASQSVRD